MEEVHEPINHTKLLRELGYGFISASSVVGLRTAPVVARDLHWIYAPWDSAPGHPAVGGLACGMRHAGAGAGGSKPPVIVVAMGPGIYHIPTLLVLGAKRQYATCCCFKRLSWRPWWELELAA
jgi:hypothetical protein